MESLFILFYVTAEPWSPVFSRPSWAYQLVILRLRLKGKTKTKINKRKKNTLLSISCPFRIQLFLCRIGRRKGIFPLCYILLITELSVTLFNCLCVSNYNEPETIPSTATCIWITGVLSSSEKSLEAKKGDSCTGLTSEMSLVDTISH